jgi:hypothetical protein
VARITVVEILESALNLARTRGPALGNLNASEFDEPIPFVRGNTAKICFPRYSAVSPNIARVPTLGHVSNSSPNAATQAFISSEMGKNLGCGLEVMVWKQPVARLNYLEAGFILVRPEHHNP